MKINSEVHLDIEGILCRSEIPVNSRGNIRIILILQQLAYQYIQQIKKETGVLTHLLGQNNAFQIWF